MKRAMILGCLILMAGGASGVWAQAGTGSVSSLADLARLTKAEHARRTSGDVYTNDNLPSGEVGFGRVIHASMWQDSATAARESTLPATRDQFFSLSSTTVAVAQNAQAPVPPTAAPMVAPRRIPAVAPKVATIVAPRSTPLVTPKVATLVAPKRTPVVAPKIATAIAPKRTPVVAPKIAIIVAPNLAPAIAPNIATGVAARITPVVAPKSAPVVATVALVVAPELAPQAAPVPAPPVKPAVVPLKVSYVGGQLSIDASNSTLSDVLTKVAALTGMTLDVPPGASSEVLTIVKLGPGAARQVLASLLSESNFDYLIQAPTADPEGIQSVMLLAREKKGAEGKGADPAAHPSYARAGASASRSDDIPEPIAPVLTQPDNTPPAVSASSPAASQPDFPAFAQSPLSPAVLSNQSGLTTAGAMNPPSTLDQPSITQQLQQMYQQRAQISQQTRSSPTTTPAVPASQ